MNNLPLNDEHADAHNHAACEAEIYADDNDKYRAAYSIAFNAYLGVRAWSNP